MAPELRKKKSQSGIGKDGTVKKASKPVTATKRKAADDAAPVTSKKRKPVKTISTGSLATKKRASNGPATSEPSRKKAKNITPVSKDEQIVNDVVDLETKALVRALDSESEDDVEGNNTFTEGQDVGTVPSHVAKKGSKSSGQEATGVIYLGGIPHGFYEHEMRQYFSQFGQISKLRLSRNKKTGASKHYAFIEFAEESTAEIVAKTMDSYLLFGHILRCKLVPKSQQHESLFKGANRRFSAVPWNKMAGTKLKGPKSEADWADKVDREQKRRAARAEKLKALGYEFEPPQLKAPVGIAQKTAALEDGKEVAPESEAVVVPAAVEGAVTEVAKIDAAKEAKPAKAKKAKAKKASKSKEAKA